MAFDGFIFAFIICHVLLTFSTAFICGYAYKKKLDDKALEDLSNLVQYFDPSGSKREVGKALKNNELKQLSNGYEST